MSRKRYFFISVALIVVLILRFWLNSNSVNLVREGERIQFSTRIGSDPEIKNGKQLFRLKMKNGQRIYVTTGLDPQLKYGDKILIEGDISEKVYDDFSLFTMSYPVLQIVRNDQNFVARLAVAIRQKADTIYQKTLPPTSAGLLSGIVFGGDRNLPEKFSDDLRVSGVTHVIAASGMNVTFVASFLMGAFAIFFRRQFAITIAIFGIFFYAFIAGFESSIVRAAIMGGLVFSAKLLGRESLAIFSLVITAAAMLFYNPAFVSDVGFQLSVAATAGIVLIKPIMDKGFKKLGRLGMLGKEDIGTTIAAQIATIPILLGTFGTFSLHSILVNALVLWTIPLLMVIGAVGLMVGAIFEPLGQILILSAAPLLFYFERIVSLFAKFNWSISVHDLSISIQLGYYLILGAVLLIISIKSQK